MSCRPGEVSSITHQDRAAAVGEDQVSRAGEHLGDAHPGVRCAGVLIGIGGGEREQVAYLASGHVDGAHALSLAQPHGPSLAAGNPHRLDHVASARPVPGLAARAPLIRRIAADHSMQARIKEGTPRWGAAAEASGALVGRFDVVVDAGRREQPVLAAFVDADSRLGRQLVAAPADAVVLHGAAHAVVGHRAVLQADTAAGAEALGEERAELIGAAVGVLRAAGLPEVPVRRRRC